MYDEEVQSDVGVDGEHPADGAVSLQSDFPTFIVFHISISFDQNLILSPNYLTFRFLLLWSSSPISLQSRYCQITFLICYDRCSLCLATITLISNDNVSAMNTFLPCLLVCFISRICQNTFLS